MGGFGGVALGVGGKDGMVEVYRILERKAFRNVCERAARSADLDIDSIVFVVERKFEVEFTASRLSKPDHCPIRTVRRRPPTTIHLQC